MIDWRADDIQREVVATRDSLVAYDRAIVESERDLQIANAAHSEYEADVRALTAQQVALRSIPLVEITDEQGFETMGPSPATRRQYDQLAEAIKAREAEYQKWVNARTVNYNDGPIAQSWSPRNPVTVAKRIERLRITREVTTNRLRELEGKLSPGQLCEIGTPAAEYTEHTARTAALREQAGVA